MKLRPPVKWYGGKYYLASKIISLFPPHSTYVEPFGGGASVLLNKPAAGVEVYNDLDRRVTRLFKVLRDDGDELRRRLSLTPYSEAEFDAVLDQSFHKDEVDEARADFIRFRMSIAGRGDSFSYTLHRQRAGMADVVSSWLSIVEQLPATIERLRKVQILCRPAIDVIKMFDSPDTLLYCDPPYTHATRVSTDVYEHEMTEQQHVELAGVLRGCQGKVVVSGYYSALYEHLYGDWRNVAFDVPNNAAGGRSKSRKTENLWLNF